MKPITKVPEEELARMIEERVSPLGEKLEEISIKLTKDRDRERPKEEKIEEIIAKIKAKQPEKIKKQEDKEKEEVKDEHIDDVDCPTCKTGHVHKVVGNSLALKCTENKCGEEYVLVSKNADHICADCGLPIKKPVEGKKLGECPFCYGHNAMKIKNGIPEIKFDFTMMKK